MEAIIALLAATIGLLRELYATMPTTAANQHISRGRRLFATRTLLFAILFVMTAIWLASILYNAKHPSAYIATKVYPGGEKGYFNLEQHQSYFQPSASIISESLYKKFTSSGDGNAKTEVTLTYLSSDAARSYPGRPDRDLDFPINKGTQHNIEITATNAIIPYDKEGANWGECSGWTGIDYKLTGPKQLREAIFLVDLSATSKTKNDCTSVLAQEGAPRIKWVEMGYQDKQKPHQECLNAMELMQRASPQNSCLWYSRLHGIGPEGRVLIRWEPLNQNSL